MSRISGLLLTVAITACAAPASALPRAEIGIAQQPQVQLVRDGCGRGWHRNDWDRCVPNRRDWEWRRRHHRHWDDGGWDDDWRRYHDRPSAFYVEPGYYSPPYIYDGAPPSW